MNFYWPAVLIGLLAARLYAAILPADHEQEPFLEKGQNNFGETGQVTSSTISRRANYVFTVIQAIVLAVNLFLLWRNVYAGPNGGKARVDPEQIEAPWSPARPAVRHKIETIDLHPHKSPFAGKPRLQLNEAWSELSTASMLRVSEEEMRAMNKTSITLQDGAGYIGYLEVFHMLHCVYRDYYPDLVNAGRLTTPHWEHCLEVIRQGIMCNADVTLNTYKWDLSDPTNVAGNSLHPRKCVDWTHLKAWADERAVGRDYQRKLVPSLETDSMGPIDLLT